MPKRYVALALCLAGCIALLVTGCGPFWDWLAGEPISQPFPAGDVSAGGREDARDREEEQPPSSSFNGDPSETVEGGSEAGDDAESASEPPPLGPFASIQIRPVDEGRSDESFARFRTELLSILKERDTAGLLARVDPSIQNTLEGDEGIEAFRQRWGLNERAEESPVWTVLTDILALGGVFTDAERTRFEAPYVAARYDAELDPMFFSVVTGAGVNVRAAPDLNAPVIGRVSYHVVRPLPAEDEELPQIELSGRRYSWVKVQLPSGEVGYLVDRYLRSPLEDRAGFEKTDAGWQMSYLLRGL